jgi:hypothetical protein
MLLGKQLVCQHTLAAPQTLSWLNLLALALTVTLKPLAAPALTKAEVLLWILQAMLT